MQLSLSANDPKALAAIEGGNSLGSLGALLSIEGIVVKLELEALICRF